MDLGVVLRECTDDDLNYVKSSYLLHFRDSFPTKYIPKRLYMSEQSRILNAILERSNVLIACFPESPDEIAGWVISENRDGSFVLHYLYVRVAYRGMGVERQLLNAAAADAKMIVYSHMNDEYKSMRKAAQPRCLVYDPYRATRKEA